MYTIYYIIQAENATEIVVKTRYYVSLISVVFCFCFDFRSVLIVLISCLLNIGKKEINVLRTCVKQRFRKSAHLRSLIRIFTVCIFMIINASTFLHADNENSDQTAWMHRLV